MFDISNNQILVSRDVEFFEHIFPYSDSKLYTKYTTLFPSANTNFDFDPTRFMPHFDNIQESNLSSDLVHSLFHTNFVSYSHLSPTYQCLLSSLSIHTEPQNYHQLV